MMRIYFLSRVTDLTMLITPRSDYRRHLSPDTKTFCSLFSGKLGLLAFSAYWLFRNRRDLDNAVILTEPTFLGILGFWAKLFSNIKWVVDVWDIPIRHLGNWGKLIKWRIWATRVLMKFMYRKADLFIVGIRPELQFRYYQVPERKILAWQTAIWLPTQKEKNWVDEDDEYFNILCMKSIHTPECGLDTLSQAFLQVRKQIPKVRLWIIGKILEEVEKDVQELRRLEEVEILGYLEHEKVMQLIRRAHLCVIPWHNDVDLAQLYPTKVMEYMTEGKVVLAARVAGIAEMILDGEDGLLHRPGDPADLAEKILKLYGDEALRRRLADNARRYHPKFDTYCQHEAVIKAIQGLVHDTSNIDVYTLEHRSA